MEDFPANSQIPECALKKQSDLMGWIVINNIFDPTKPKNKMKKLLLSAIVALGTLYSVNAQTIIYSQNFEASTTSLPGNMTLQTTSPVNGGWKFGNTYGANMNNYVATHTYCAFVDDWDNNAGAKACYDTLITNSMNCSAYPKVYIGLDYMFWNDDSHETGTIAVSTNGGATWTKAVTLTDGGSAWANGAIYDISALAGGQANVMVAFTYYNGDATTNTYVAVGMCVDNISIYAPANYDLSVATQNLPYLMQVGKPYTFSGTINNFGGTAITSMNMNYSVNGGPAQTQTISAISGFNGLTTYNWSMNTTPYTPASANVYNVKFWADNLNGSNADNNNANDTLTASFWAIDSVKVRQSIYEEFTGQSCVFCMIAAPNMDTVAVNNAASSNIVKYHVPIPARDFMYDVTTAPVNARTGYYGVSGAPDGYLNGTQVYPGADYGPPPTHYSSYTLQADNKIGSPMKIDITKATFDPTTDTFKVSATITSYAAFASGLKAHCVLTIDSMTYKYDLSMDDPQQEFAPPLGSSSSCCSYAGAPDRYFDYLLKYEHVVQAMLPSGSGTSLGAFTVGQSQTLNLSWKKNHPWGAYDKGAQHDSDLYDSSSSFHFVVFVQTNAAIPADGVPAHYVFQSANKQVSYTTGMEELSNGVYFEMYPNPTNNNTNINFTLQKDQNVNVEVYNMLGEKVYSANQGRMSTGQHVIEINGTNLQSGVYFVRFNTDNVTTTKKLVIQK